ncbi:phospholipid/cholesterol/gamma-HCH transport system permease protein [Rhodovulum bhavnagarense]|uniref:Phospholipid/cholesterol/gamma-HCH transport system permease protein n=1 Tax=Rhodovulum bhavnagarense TaxID=992286 RepID=A0A4R2RR49_9RHOB|nr:ABC transporter permease [Rhodovulum bhavnagarense]TCP61645.1 phospholipid/cholesterol/gamma-HCH transport system permease protein [Rhodovulum bhavnagarense]
MTDRTHPGPAALDIENAGEAQHLRFAGRVGIDNLAEIQARLAGVVAAPRVVIDLSQADMIDTSIAWVIETTRRKLVDAGGTVEIKGAAPDLANLLDTVAEAMPVPEPVPAPPGALIALLTGLGKAMTGLGSALVEFAGILGLFLARLVQSVLRPRRFRLTALVHHCEAVGVQAVPIVALMAFLIGIVLAFQGSAQLRQFGAEVFVVDLIAISILRELGILLTAIIVAGRTASAFTAAIGSMKMREEIDAMHTLGIDPGHALIVPRVLAMVVMLPILGLIANLSGLFGGALMSWVELGISPAMFVTRLVEGTDVEHVIVGLVKAPVFAVLIGVIGCQAGLGVGKTAESLGRMTSSAVVAAIFAVILADALFSIFFQRIGI